MNKIYSKYIRSLCLIVTCIIINSAHADDVLHQPLTEVLSESVNDGQVNYKSIKNNAKFSKYVKSLESKPNTQNESEELSFWINSYNALAIQGILNGRSPKSFTGRIGYFKNAKYDVGGKRINLYDLERKVIIPLNEPRIHFAINCASFSCPNLLPEAYTAEKLEQQLEQVSKDFINDSSKNKFDKTTKKASISKIFDWFKDDFIKHSGSVEKYIAQYVSDAEVAEDLRAGKYKIKYLKYNWSLNGTAP